MQRRGSRGSGHEHALLERDGVREVWLVVGTAADNLPTRRALVLLRRVMFSSSTGSSVLRRFVATRQLDRGALPQDPSESWTRLRKAVIAGELGVSIRQRPTPRCDPGVRLSPTPTQPMPEPFPPSVIQDDDRALFITHCDAVLAGEDPLRFSYLIRGLDDQPTILRITSQGATPWIVHEQALSLADCQDGVHDAEWDGIVSTAGQLHGQRLPAEHGPCLLELIYDDGFHDQASFVIPAVSTTAYELQLLDEHEQPLAGIPIQITTPLGAQVVVTDADGLAGVEAPQGQATAAVADLDLLRSHLAETLHAPCRSDPLPVAPDLHVRTLGDLQATLPLPFAQRQRLLLMTRCDIEHHDDDHDWGTRSLDPGDALALASSEDLFTVQILADGLHRQLSVVGEAPPRLDFTPPEIQAPPDELGCWEAPDVYVVQAGDTLVAIAARSLGDASRWKEIWALNAPAYIGRSPDLIYPGDRFHMPADGVPLWLRVQAASAPPADPGPAPAPPTWLSLDVDALLKALVSDDLDTAASLLKQIVDEPPDPPPTTPAPVIETLLVDAFITGRALQGQVDPPMPNGGEEIGPVS